MLDLSQWIGIGLMLAFFIACILILNRQTKKEYGRPPDEFQVGENVFVSIFMTLAAVIATIIFIAVFELY